MKLQELFARRGSWCKYSYAVDKSGGSVETYSPDAVKFCLAGGVKHCYPPNKQPAIMNKIAKKIDPDFKKNSQDAEDILTTFNDSTTVTKVRKLCQELDI